MLSRMRILAVVILAAARLRAQLSVMLRKLVAMTPVPAVVRKNSKSVVVKTHNKLFKYSPAEFPKDSLNCVSAATVCPGLD